ncbi:unnamed protein product [Arctia plantaginis]|uniref:Uncharacterized protein n=1 Tax=Arctia plantaginis TaxID=874455 RepID=A0A8S1BN11_ARCPL|nr:unnamed protein product [Arctia plantaginis]
MMATVTPYENLQPSQTFSPFSKCCFCIPLRTGCFILGYTSLVINFIITMFYAGSLAIMAILTHGFRYIHVKQTPSGEVVPDVDSLDKAKLHMTIMVILLVGFLNVSWLMLNGFLLVGLHKKKPGPIRVHVTVATIRLLLSVLGIITMNTNKIGFCWVEIALSGYFIMMYYTYAMQLDRENKSEEPKPTADDVVTEIVFSYPKNIDKLKLTDKDLTEVVNANA